MPKSNLHLFQTAADAALAYRHRVETLPPLPAMTAADMRAVFAGPTPERGSDGDMVISELATKAEPGLMAMTGPRFFGWVIGASHPVGVAADWLASAWGQNCGNHIATPAAAAAESISAQWLLDILRLPSDCSVGFVTGATMANFVCLAAARSEMLRQAGWNVEDDGLYGAPSLHVFIGAEAHATVFAALQYLGLGRKRVVRIATDEDGRMDAEDLGAALAKAEGAKIVVAQAGQINSGAFDPFDKIVPLCRAHNAWLHVDGAFGLWAQVCPDYAHLSAGVEGADSWATDGHKWLQLPYDSGFAIVRHPEAHRRAMTITASYLPVDSNSERDPSHLVPELSRRARGFAAWAVIKAMGRTGIAEMVRRHCQMAAYVVEKLSSVPGIEVLNKPELNQAVIAFGPGLPQQEQDRLTRAVIAGLQERNRCFVGGGQWRGRWVMRISIISEPTAWSDIEILLDEIVAVWADVKATMALCET